MKNGGVPGYLKVLLGISLTCGIIGAGLSFAGPIVSLNNDLSNLNAVNFKQAYSMPQFFSYFKCGDELALNLTLWSNTSTTADAAMLRAGATVFKSACEDGKLPHIYLAWLSGALTLVGLATFLLCMCLERPEPELVFVVPLILSFVMLYDFLMFNSEIRSYIKDCTAYESKHDNSATKMQNVILWSYKLERLGVVSDGDVVCTSEDNCSPKFADDMILCSKYYDCSESPQSCNTTVISDNAATTERVVTDKAVDAIKGQLTLWLLGAVFNIIGMGLLLFVSFMVRVFLSIEHAGIAPCIENP